MMIRHLIKVVWNMRRANALIILEILISFLVVFAVVTGAIFFGSNYRQPLGYSIDNVWNIRIDMKQMSDNDWDEAMTERFTRVLSEIESLDPVLASAGIQYPPYAFGQTTWVITRNGRKFRTHRNEVTDGAREVLGLDLIEGRWFEASDDAFEWKPVVIDVDAAKAFFGDEDPIGRAITEPDSSREYRVVGVVSEFRKGGEFESKTNYVFERQQVSSGTDRPPRNVLIKVRPGTTSEFETVVIERLQAIVPEWSFDVRPLASSRELALKVQTVPLIVGGVISSFLILMVVLGLTGVMWQNVTRRTREIGLRRAMGASASAIYRQIILEILIITSVGLLLGTLVVIQIPLLGWFGFLSRTILTSSLAIALLLIYALTTICGLYPSWLASRVPPAEALHYE